MNAVRCFNHTFTRQMHGIHFKHEFDAPVKAGWEGLDTGR